MDGPGQIRADLPALLPRLWRFAVVLSGDRATAEELVQAACVRALERAHQFQPGTHVDRWVMSILASIWRNEARAESVRRGQGRMDASEALSVDIAPDLETHILIRQVLKAVGDLPEAQRSAVMLVYVEGFSYREAATALDVPIGTVMSRLAAAKSRLAEAVRAARPQSAAEGEASS